jgi:transcription-repair coupling factor (superfamily II helicase)
LRVTEYQVTSELDPAAPEENAPPIRPPASLVATRLVKALRSSNNSLCYVALSETSADKIAGAIRCLFPEIEVIVFPPWDCLPYDRVPPSRQCMGRRMDALRVWRQPHQKPRLMLTSLDAALQRVPPIPVVDKTRFEVVTGQPFDREAFADFARRTGYIEEGLADDPGELAIREEVIDIFPAGAQNPMRIILSNDDYVTELRSYNPITQRTEGLLDQMVFGPASEVITAENQVDICNTHARDMERALVSAYATMPTLFDCLENPDVAFARGTEERIEHYWSIISDACDAHRKFRAMEGTSAASIYLSRDEWKHRLADLPTFKLDLADAEALPSFSSVADQRKALAALLTEKYKPVR